MAADETAADDQTNDSDDNGDLVETAADDQTNDSDDNGDLVGRTQLSGLLQKRRRIQMSPSMDLDVQEISG